jgi:hypothetical protein
VAFDPAACLKGVGTSHMMRRLATKNAFFPQTDLHGRKFGFDMYSQVVADFLL